MLVEVFIKLIAVLATYLEEDNVILWILSSVNYVETVKPCFAILVEDPHNRSVAFDDQTIHNLETLLLTYYIPDQLRCFAMTADPSTPNQNAFKKKVNT